jgi:hypothetical protein
MQINNIEELDLHCAHSEIRNRDQAKSNLSYHEFSLRRPSLCFNVRSLFSQRFKSVHSLPFSPAQVSLLLADLDASLRFSPFPSTLGPSVCRRKGERRRWRVKNEHFILHFSFIRSFLFPLILCTPLRTHIFHSHTLTYNYTLTLFAQSTHKIPQSVYIFIPLLFN